MESSWILPPVVNDKNAINFRRISCRESTMEKDYVRFLKKSKLFCELTVY